MYPNLVETVKGYATHEKRSLKILQLDKSLFLHKPAEKQAETSLPKRLRQLFAVAEHIRLKASETLCICKVD